MTAMPNRAQILKAICGVLMMVGALATLVLAVEWFTLTVPHDSVANRWYYFRDRAQTIVPLTLLLPGCAWMLAILSKRQKRDRQL
jgi:hypothetical protein